MKRLLTSRFNADAEVSSIGREIRRIYSIIYARLNQLDMGVGLQQRERLQLYEQDEEFIFALYSMRVIGLLSDLACRNRRRVSRT